MMTTDQLRQLIGQIQYFKESICPSYNIRIGSVGINDLKSCVAELKRRGVTVMGSSRYTVGFFALETTDGWDSISYPDALHLITKHVDSICQEFHIGYFVNEQEEDWTITLDRDILTHDFIGGRRVSYFGLEGIDSELKGVIGQL